MEPLVGFEPTTYSLRMNCSTPELQRRVDGGTKPDGRNFRKNGLAIAAGIIRLGA
jgi:hypothetical protein